MDSTSPSLLQRLRSSDEQEAWDRFAEIYTPFLYHCASRIGLRDEAAADLVQDVFVVLLNKLPQLSYNPELSFRSWLYTVTLNRWREHMRRKSSAQVTAVPELFDTLESPELEAAFEESEYQRHIIGRALQIVQTELPSKTIEAFQAHVVAGQSAKQVASQLDLSISAIYVAKHRVLKCLREYLAEML